MRIWDRLRGSFLTDEVDPTLVELLPRQREHTIDSFHLARARARVDARLTEVAQPHGGLLRRVALATFGGGGMWAGLLSTVAANKAAAAAIGLSVLAGGTVAETTGIGPAVRDAVAHTVTHEDDGGGELLVEATETATATPTETTEADDESNAAVSVSEGNPLPGNLVTHVGPNGRFQLRAEIVSADGATLVLLTPDGELEIDVSDAEVVAAGNPTNDVAWEDYVDYGVFVSGACLDEEPAELLTDCQDLEIARVHLLGRAGQGGQPEDAGKPEGVGAASESAGQPLNVGTPEDAGQPEGTGKPEDAGKPEGTGKPEDAGRPEGVGQPTATPPGGGRPTSGPGAPSD